MRGEHRRAKRQSNGASQFELRRQKEITNGCEVHPQGLDVSAILGFDNLLFIRGRYSHIDDIAPTFQIRGNSSRHRLMG